jgi:hypothetical protein
VRNCAYVLIVRLRLTLVQLVATACELFVCNLLANAV